MTARARQALVLEMVKIVPEFDPTCGGHPFLRRKSPSRRYFVVVGRSTQDPADEVWTWSRRLVRTIAELATMGSDVWCDTYTLVSGRGTYRRFLSRESSERLIVDACELAERTVAIWTPRIHKDEVMPGQLGERIFDLLVSDGLLKNPPARDVACVVSRHHYAVKGDGSSRDVSDPNPKTTKLNLIKRERHWTPASGDRAAEWAAPRLILLGDLNAEFI